MSICLLGQQKQCVFPLLQATLVFKSKKKRQALIHTSAFQVSAYVKTNNSIALAKINHMVEPRDRVEGDYTLRTWIQESLNIISN